MICRVLLVSTSGFDCSRKAQPEPRAQRSARLRESVAAVLESSKQVDGSFKQVDGRVKIAHGLETDSTLETACRKTVAKAMREIGLKRCISTKFKPITTQAGPSKQPAPNLPAQQSTATAPNQEWVADPNYLPTAAGWVDLAVVLDRFSREVVGWGLSESLATPVVSTALRQAIESRGPKSGDLLHHSDRGCQYTSEDDQLIRRTLGISCSMGRTGCCDDNAVMERFLWSLKHEWTKFETFADIQDARLCVFRDIETFDTTERIHQSLGYLTPNRFEAQHSSTRAASTSYPRCPPVLGYRTCADRKTSMSAYAESQTQNLFANPPATSRTSAIAARS